MNQARYTIQLDTFHGLILSEVCHYLEMSLAHQLEEETARRKKWFYRPTPGIHIIDRMAVEMQAVRRTILTKMDHCTGQLIVNEPSANLLITALVAAKAQAQAQPEPDPQLIAAIDALANQLPFNTTVSGNAIFWNDIHPQN